MPMFGTVAVVTLLATWFASSGPEATAVRLDWQAPSDCPSAAQVERWIGGLLGEASAQSRVSAAVVVSPDLEGVGYRSSLQVDMGQGIQQRELWADDCAVLARANAVVIAVSFDPVVVAETTHDTTVAFAPAPEPAVPQPPAPKPRTSMRGSRAHEPVPSRQGNDSSPPIAARRRPVVGAMLMAGVGGGIMPSPGVGLGLAPALRWHHLELRAVGHYWASRRVELQPGQDIAGQLRLLSGGARACGVLERGPWRFPLCAGADAGALVGRGIGTGLRVSTPARGLWAGAVLGPQAQVELAPWMSLSVSVDGVVSLYRPLFDIEGAPGQWTAGAAAVRGWVGVVLHGRRRPR